MYQEPLEDPEPIEGVGLGVGVSDGVGVGVGLPVGVGVGLRLKVIKVASLEKAKLPLLSVLNTR